LERNLRNQLEKAVSEARSVAEAGAMAVLDYLGVPESSPYDYMSEEQRDLRRRLRSHGRQLGDSLNGGVVQSIDRLTEEVAYEHWHRMLFARFLAENRLLMYGADDPIDIDLETCQGLLDEGEEQASSVWELASQLASAMLPQIFRADSPSFELTFPAEYQLKLEKILTDLPEGVFHASDSLGWVYQYWQSKRKEEVNASEVKIGERELPAVTQLFTENYMVRFLLDNSLGAWWADRQLSEADYVTADSESELRYKAAVPGVPLEYLRFSRSEDGVWSPAAGSFPHWPKDITKLKILDPCCGSGHFLVETLLMLIPLRMDLEQIGEAEAIDRILKENLYGLELDKRCVELAAFSLAFTAWRYPGAGGYRRLPELHIACSGLSVKAEKETWSLLSHGRRNLQLAMNKMYEIFTDAPVLGSLLDPSHSELTALADWSELSAALNQALRQEQDLEVHETAVAAQGLVKAVAILAESYDLIITNVPYLSRGKQAETLRTFADDHYPEAKNDLATMFLDRCLGLCKTGGTVSIVLPQNWLFLTSYKKFREKLLKKDTWNLIARLGAGGFQTPMWDFNVQLITLTSGGGEEIITRGKQEELVFSDDQQAHLIRGLDVSGLKTPKEKADGLRGEDIKEVEQARQLENPDARVALDIVDIDELLSDYSYSFHGLTSGDMPRMKFPFWEIIQKNGIWIPFQSTVLRTIIYGGNEAYLRWEDGKGAIKDLKGARKDGVSIWGENGVLISQMRELSVTLYSKKAFDNNTAVIVPNNPAHLPAIWCYCSSPEYHEAVRQVDQSLKVTNATLVKVPFDLEHWSKVAEEQYPHGLPKPYSDDPTPSPIVMIRPSGSFMAIPAVLSCGMRKPNGLLMVHCALMIRFSRLP